MIPDSELNGVTLLAVKVGEDAWKTIAMYGVENDEDMDDLDLMEYGNTPEEALGKAVLALNKALAGKGH